MEAIHNQSPLTGAPPAPDAPLPSATAAVPDAKSILPGTELSQEDLQSMGRCGIPPELARTAFLRRVNAEEGQEEVGRSGELAGLLIPYMLPGSPAIRKLRLKLDTVQEVILPDGSREKGRYQEAEGSYPLLYFVPGTQPESLQDIQLPVCITNGEESALALLSVFDGDQEVPSFLPIGIAGERGWWGRSLITGPEGKQLEVEGPIPDLDRLAWRGREVYLCFGSDSSKSRKKLASELSARDAKVYLVDVPTDVQGVDQWIAKSGAEAVKKAVGDAAAWSTAVPEGFKLTKRGVFTLDAKNRWQYVCDPLEVVAETSDAESNQWGRLLKWKDPNGRGHEWVLPMLLINETGMIQAHLASEGLMSDSREALLRYIKKSDPKRSVECVDRIGWHGHRFVLPDGMIGAEGRSSVRLQVPSGYHHAYNVSGTLAEWRHNIGLKCSGNTRLIFSVSCAFAAPLLHLVQAESGGLNWVGLSASGKTTLLQVAASVVGGGPGGFIRPWRTTTNGLEAIASLHNHTLLCLDELAMIDPRDLGDAVYMLSNGQGKQRMTKSISYQAPLSWKLLFLSSGEIGLADHMGVAGKQARGGQAVRLIDLPVDAGARMGAFENIHGAPTPDEFARTLKKAAGQYYGTPLRVFLDAVVKDQEGVRQMVQNTRKKFSADHVPTKSCGEVFRAAERFALIGAAGEYATTRGITGWKEGEAMQAAAVLFETWLANRGSAGAADLEAAVSQIRQFIEAHGQSRFQTISSNDKVNNRAGYKERRGDDTLYYFLSDTFKKEVCKGFDLSAVLATMKERGFLYTISDEFTVRLRADGGRPRCYAVWSRILGDTDIVANPANPDGDDMPW